MSVGGGKTVRAVPFHICKGTLVVLPHFLYTSATGHLQEPMVSFILSVRYLCKNPSMTLYKMTLYSNPPTNLNDGSCAAWKAICSVRTGLFVARTWVVVEIRLRELPV